MSPELQEAIQKYNIKAKWNYDKAIGLFLLLIFVGIVVFLYISV